MAAQTPMETGAPGNENRTGDATVIVMLHSRVLWKAHSKDHPVAVAMYHDDTLTEVAVHHSAGRNSASWACWSGCRPSWTCSSGISRSSSPCLWR